MRLFHYMEARKDVGNKQIRNAETPLLGVCRVVVTPVLMRQTMSRYTKKSIEEMPKITEHWPHSKGAVLFEYKGVEICFGRSDYGDYYYHCWVDGSGKKIKLGDQEDLEECKKEIDNILETGFQGNVPGSRRMSLIPIPFYN